MKNTKTYLLLLALIGLPLLFSACSGTDEPEPDDNNRILQIDGDNLTAPLFPGGIPHETAVQFPANLVEPYVGQELTSVEIFIGQLPESMEIRVYGNGNTNNPGDLLLSQSVTVTGSPGRFQTFALTNPLTIPAGDLWISAVVQSSEDLQIIGCDRGPAVAGGDWYVEGGGAFRTFRSFTQGSADINWNIRGIVGGR